MKRIGIITIHNSPSFGASLQSFALFRYVQQQGCECEIIDLYRPANDGFVRSHRYTSYAEKNRTFLQRQKARLRQNPLLRKSSKAWNHVCKQKFDDFNSMLRLSQPYRRVDDLYQNPPAYDVYISGSDQLWNPDQPFCIEPYFLTFVRNGGKKISYASSIGLSALPQKVKSDFREWLLDFDAISVREKTAKSLVGQLVGKEVKEVLDPTFLLDITEWEKLAIVPLEGDYVLLFTLSLNQHLLEFATRYACEKGLAVVGMGNWDSPNENVKKVDDVGPREFLGYIQHAKAVFTDSFHGTVFSIILGAGQVFPYISKRSKRGSRIADLLRLFHLEDRMLHEESMLRTYPEIERDDILRILQAHQADSRRYIDEYIK